MPDPTRPYSADNPFAPKQPAAPAGRTYSPDNPFAPAPESFGDEAKGVARAFLGQGVAAGWGDEIEAAVRAPFSDRSYSAIRDDIRGQQADFAGRHPVINGGAELAGGIAGAMIPLGGAELRTLSTAAKIGRAGMVGAAYGGVAGLGKGEGDAGAQAGSTIKGAALGALMGAGFQGAGSAVGAVAQRVSEPPAQRALRQVATAVGRSGTLAAPQPGMILADALGTPGQRLLDYAVTVPSQGGTDAAEYLAARATGRGARLQQGVESALGTGRGDVVADDAAMHAARSAAAKQNYGAAYQESVPVGLFERLANIDGPNPFAKAYEHGRASASIDGVKLPAWAKIEDALTNPTPDANTLRDVPVQALDYMQRGVGKLVRRGGESDFAIDKTDARNMYAALKDVMAQADTHAPMFGRARGAFHDDSELIDALEAGQSAFRSKPAQIAQDVGALSPPAQTRYRQGMAEDVWSRITGRDVLGTRSLRALQTPTAIDALGAAAPTPEQGAALRALLGTEQTMATTETTALKNSATARRLLQARDVEGAGMGDLMEPAKAGLSALTGNFGPALHLAAQRGYARYAQGVNERTGDALAALLTAGRRSPQEIADVLEQIGAFNASGAAVPPSRAVAGRLGGRAAGFLLGSGR